MIKKIPKVSVVVPVYNVEEYVAEMLDSVTNQTMEDIEIICINDASTDGSLYIVEQFAKRDSRINIINNSRNLGAALCRNIGIQNSEGLYICFLDSDDIYSKDLIREEYLAICRQNADIAVVHSMNFEKALRNSDFSWSENEIWQEEQSISVEDSEQIIFKAWNVAPWNKMYRKSFIEKYGLSYQSLTSSNDVFFGIMGVLLAKKIVLVKSNGPMVFHRVSTGTQISSNRSSLNAYLALKKIHDMMVEQSIWEKYFEVYFEFFYNAMVSEYQRCKDEEINHKTYRYIAENGLQELGFFEIKREAIRSQYFYSYKGLENFTRYSYESVWINNYDKFLMRNNKKIVSKLKWYNEKNKKIAVWGVGERAKSLMRFSKENNCIINFWIDSDVSKQGKEINGIEINKFENISNLLDVVLVLNSLYYDEIVDAVRNVSMQVEVCNFEEYLLLQ